MIDNAIKPAQRMFRDAAPLIAEGEALRALAEQDGYLFFRNLLDRERLMAVRSDMLGILQKWGMRCVKK